MRKNVTQSMVRSGNKIRETSAENNFKDDVINEEENEEWTEKKVARRKKVEYGLSLMWKEHNILESDLSQEERKNWESTVKSWLSGDCVIVPYKGKSRYPIVEYKEPKSVLTMEELQDEVESLKKEVGKLKESSKVAKIKKKETSMKKGLTEIGIVLDKSGSMGIIREDTIGGFNVFIEEQKKEKGSANITLINFNDKLEHVYKCEDIQNVSELTLKNYAPTGWTAMYDGIGVMLDTLNADIEKRDDKNKPEKVIVVIITDGMENYSKEYNSKQIKEKIENFKSKDWDFIYLGANQDAFAESRNMGISKSSTSEWDSTKLGVGSMYASVTSTMSKYRNTGVVNFEKDEEVN